MLEIFGPRVERAVGVDLSREMLAVARVNLERSALRNCSIRQADMYQLPLPGGSFDAVVIHQVLHYAEDPAQVIAEAARVLRPGGRLVIADFAPHELEFLRSRACPSPPRIRRWRDHRCGAALPGSSPSRCATCRAIR